MGVALTGAFGDLKLLPWYFLPLGLENFIVRIHFLLEHMQPQMPQNRLKRAIGPTSGEMTLVAVTERSESHYVDD